MTVDISSEAVEQVIDTVHRAAAVAMRGDDKYKRWPLMALVEADETLRAQAERIKELEAENAILRTEKHADAEAIGALRDELARFRSDRPFVIGWNDGFKHGVKEAVLALDEQWRENSAVKKAAILDLIEGDTND